MNHVDRRSFSQLLSDYRDEPAGELRERRYDALCAFVDGHARRELARDVDAGVVIPVKTDTAKSKAETLCALLHEARVLAGELALELPTEGGRDAARQYERVLGNGGDVTFNDSGLLVDSPRLDCCSGPMADIDESLKPHIDSPRFDEAANHFEAA